MNEQFIVLSDIHANLSALEAVIADFECRYSTADTVVLLGDLINYGMRPNEVISRMQELEVRYKINIRLFGNHEKALMDGDTSHFSTERGKQVLGVTRNLLTPESSGYLREFNPQGLQELEINRRQILFVHGSIQDPFWGKLNETNADDIRYAKYDYVISGHSHIPRLIEKFYSADRPEYRNKKRTVFLNPGSVGQPRNHNHRAQYLYADLSNETFHFNTVPYDIEKERSLYTEEIDHFYSDRLVYGI